MDSNSELEINISILFYHYSNVKIVEFFYMRNPTCFIYFKYSIFLNYPALGYFILIATVWFILLSKYHHIHSFILC